MATRLHGLLRVLPDHDAITDTLDYVVGAVYGLERAMHWGFRDRPGAWDRAYRPFLTEYVLEIAAGRDVHHLWLGGFYFNSAVQRLAASYDRIPGLRGSGSGSARDRMVSAAGGDGGEWYSVYKEVNALKHSPMGKAEGRKVTLEMALNAVDEALRLLETKADQLTAKYAITRS
jgi:hypothetical protein